MRTLVTGAGGGIGGRLVEMLALEDPTRVRAMVHSHAQAFRAARFPVELVAAEMADGDAVSSAVSGCDTVVHCAHDLERPERNAIGATNVARACLDHGVRRVVHLSSASVYEPLPDGVVDESAPQGEVPDGGDPTRLDAQRVMEEFAADGLPVVILQPAIVYGPYSVHWTMGLARVLRSGRFALPDDAEGTCNAVYLDDVVHAVRRALEAEVAGAGPYLLAGPDTVPWPEFFGALDDALSTRSVVREPREAVSGRSPRPALDAKRVLEQVSRTTLAAARHPRLRPLRRRAARILGPARVRALRRELATRRPPIRLPTERERALYAAKTELCDLQARRDLGYEPRVDFARGMELTAAFLRWANL